MLKELIKEVRRKGKNNKIDKKKKNFNNRFKINNK